MMEQLGTAGLVDANHEPMLCSLNAPDSDGPWVVNSLAQTRDSGLPRGNVRSATSLGIVRFSKALICIAPNLSHAMIRSKRPTVVPKNVRNAPRSDRGAFRTATFVLEERGLRGVELYIYLPRSSACFDLFGVHQNRARHVKTAGIAMNISNNLSLSDTWHRIDCGKKINRKQM